MADPPFLRLKNEIFLMIIEELIRGSPYTQRDTNIVCCDGPFESRRFSLDDVKSLSLVNNRLRALSINALFKHTSISDDRVSEFRIVPLIKDLRMLAKQPSILQAVRCFILETTYPEFISSYDYNTPDALWTCLRLMPNLKEISFRLRNSKLLPLLESHIDHNPKTPVLDKVHSFSIYTWGPANRARWASPNIRNILGLMPHIENISMELPYHRPIRECNELRALSRKPKLKYLMLCRVVPRPRDADEQPGWSVDNVDVIAIYVPDVKHLALVGQLDGKRGSKTQISDYVGAFARFPKLERLEMTDEFAIEPDDIDEDAVRNLAEQNKADRPDGMSQYDWDEARTDTARRSIATDLANKHSLNEERGNVAQKLFDACPTLREVYLTRCGQGELFERLEDSEVKRTRFMDTNNSHDFAHGFPRILEVNDMPRPSRSPFDYDSDF